MNDQSGTQLVMPDQITVETPPLYLPITEDVVLSTLNEAEMRGQTLRQKLNIDKRSHENTEFWKGNQVDASKLDARYQAMHVDNVVRQDLENKIKLATGHMPDIFVVPPDKQDFNMEAARDIQSYMRDRFTGSVTKRLIKNGLRKLDLELTAVIKARYDQKQKRSVFELINGSDILFGEGSKVTEDGYTIDGTDVLFHYVEEATQQVLNTFPAKAQELLMALAADGKQIPSRIRYTEAHFRWYDRQSNINEAVVWRYGHLLLGKMKQPYYDYDNPTLNYFDRVRKNFILFSYSNLGQSIYEATTDFEQGVPINRIINRRRRQITEIADRSVPKLAFLGGAMTAELAANINPSPNEAVLLSDNYTGDDIRQAMTIIPATPPNPILYNDLIDLRGRIDSMFATHGTTRGEIKGTSESGISKQITREGDLVTSDDIVDIVVERVINEMVAWEMQFLRLFHDDDRPPLRVTDKEGETEYIEMRRQKIETDVQAVVKASSTDKQTRRADALQMLTAKAIDPYTFFEDIDVNNPKERMRRLLAFIKAQQTGDYSQYMQILSIDEETPFATEEDAERDIDVLANGQQVMLRLPSEKYVSTFMALVKSPEFEAQFSPLGKQMIQNHVKRLQMLVDEEIAKRQAVAGADSQQLAGGPPGAQPPQTDTSTAFQPPQPQQSPLTVALQQASQQRSQAMQPQAA